MLEKEAEEQVIWVFGYGSLIWRPGFEYLESRQALLSHYQRSFCQASHDHRGTEQLPGRVVTLAECSGATCMGMAFRLAEPSAAVLAALDVREQDGYERTHVSLQLKEGGEIDGVTWIARPGNPSWREGESISEIAHLIATRKGPSGTNRDYLFELNRALRSLGIDDQHIAELCRRVEGLPY